MVMWRDIQANDGEKIAYQTHGEEKSMVLILIHGFTGSSDYFQRNFEALSQKYFVVAPDLRGHGKSTKAHHGYHVSRLAADLRDLLAHISRSDIQLSSHESPSIIGVGCSLGAAVLWSYSELFGTEPFSGMVFVDQAPLQDYIPGSWDFKQGNYGVHDPTSLAAAQATLKYAPEDFYRGLVHGCLAYNHEPTESERDSISPLQKAKDESFFIYISKNGNPWWFGKLLADHTSYDHRNTIMNLIRVPTFVMAGRRSGSFPVDGVLETAYLANSHSTSPGTVSTIVMDSGHCQS
ncbi:alpha/beta-hydrolase [Tothia fuscella]|uniref:Alpha/beta-hydrolase n=1 Tax=Tothia fuscella TaxID=1048955 RepID=A0A9P4TYN9_9PEZI|nr:alpha/beta-hydrolase [Tothia fuscella]